MNTPQSAILPEHLQNCIVIEANIPSENNIQVVCRQAQELLSHYQSKHPAIFLSMVIGFGAKFWHSLNHHNEGKEIKDFVPLGDGLAPSTQCDMAIHIQSNSHAINLALSIELLNLFQPALQVQSETHGFRLYEERGHEGFVDGTENPKALNRIPVAIIAEDKADAGGSYLLIQRYCHHLAKWARFSEKEQADAVGRTKHNNEELSNEERLMHSHLGRVDLEENGVKLKILRQSLPYGTASGEKGLLFIAYCHTLYNIEQQLLSMFGKVDGKVDLLLTRLSSAQSGAYYFVPSVERLINL